MNDSKPIFKPAEVHQEDLEDHVKQNQNTSVTDRRLAAKNFTLKKLCINKITTYNSVSKILMLTNIQPYILYFS